MNKKSFAAWGAAVGAGLMYLLDSDRGKRRRALIRDKAVHIKHKAVDRFDATSKDLRNRTQGVLARTRKAFAAKRVSDEIIAQKVRLAVRETVSHPAAIEVQVENRRVVLTGDVLDSEVRDLLAEVNRISEVAEIDNRLHTHLSAEHVSALQGAPAKRSRASIQ
ncbi:MAG: BON domain-containing protein [Burkholderiales bacterium]